MCHQGYRLDLSATEVNGVTKLQAQCIPNICTCRDGDEEMGEAATAMSTPHCDTDGDNICISCKAGYHLEAGQCLQNRCRCEGGTPVAPESCLVHGRVNCTSCQGGFWLANDSTVPLEDGYAYPKSAFIGHTKICMKDAATTTKPFDCLAALDNWERAWSVAKKHWCCRNERKGCVPKGTGTELCEGHGFDMQQCGMVGCCQFDVASMQCTSAVQDEICLPNSHITAFNGLCIGVVESADTNMAQLQPCRDTRANQYWSLNDVNQIQSPTNLCLEVTLGLRLLAKPCSDASSVKHEQVLEFDQGTF